jgi:hypothetical protein
MSNPFPGAGVYADLCRIVSSSLGERRRGNLFAEGSYPGSSRNGPSGLLSARRLPY